ncbi:MFS transporter [Nocardia macrotermitis]|uniref:Inner membrane protein YbjJ n=1 Tax=Nocardia macrotermitis TaxID=2585198 RepID=A0A7K0D5R7_9NOCA|nr:MFS transporter [Nocardia macrotermitis]MQY20632.1 Inner membrane protein YbjJ [Nocardia macrotermitis]
MSEIPCRTTSDRRGGSKSSGLAPFSVGVTFFVQAVLFASWTAHIPGVEAALGLSDGTLGTALLGLPIGSVTAMALCGWLLPRLGSPWLIRISMAGYGIAGIGVGLADSPVLLFVALYFWGLMQGMVDVAMNTQAVTVEKAVGRPIMSRLHGMWSVGGFAGGLIGSGAVGLGIGLTVQLAVLGVLAVVAVEVLSRYLIRDTSDTRSRSQDAPRRSRWSVLIVLLGAVAFASMLCEGAAADWSAAYLRNELGTSAATAGLGYASFALAMVAMRLSGKGLQRRFRSTSLLPVLALIFACGMGVALILGQPVVALLGFACMGLGLGLIVPSAFSAAGRVAADANPGPSIAAVSALGWCGFVSGPPLIGHLADLIGLGNALWVLPALAVILALVVRFGRAFAEPAPPQ